MADKDTWNPAWPSTWRDPKDDYTDLVPSSFPRRLFAQGTEAEADLRAHGEALGYARRLIEWILRTILPAYDTNALWLTRWEKAFGLPSAGTTAERVNALLAAMRLRRGTTDAIKAIFTPVFGETDPAEVSIVAPDPDTLNDYDVAERQWFTAAEAPYSGELQDYGLAYDSKRDRAILFGGENGGGYKSGTYAYYFDTDTWVNLSPSTYPEARSQHAMTYDVDRDVVVLFGGYDGGLYDDTWELNCSTDEWSEIDCGAAHPTARRIHDICYDETEDETVLFGGFTGSHNSETWTYEPGVPQWVQNIPGTIPSARSCHRMVYHATGGVIWMIGGYVSGSVKQVYIWDGSASDWTLQTPGTDFWPSRMEHAAWYDSTTDEVFIAGGHTQSTGRAVPSANTCRYGEYDPTSSAEDWTLYSRSGYTPRTHIRAVYSPVHKRALIVGGNADGWGTGEYTTDSLLFYANPDTFSRWQNCLHIYSTGQDVEPKRPTADRCLRRAHPAHCVWSCGKYKTGVYGTDGGTVRSKYDACVYGVRS